MILILVHLFSKLNIKQTKESQKKIRVVIDFVKKTKKKTELENKVPDISS